jgi:hypothetical protein
MKFTIILQAVFAVLLLLGCGTTDPKWNDQQAYEGRIGGANRQMGILHALDAGGVHVARRAALQTVNGMLIDLPSLETKVHVTPEEKTKETALARDILDYELLHKNELDGRWGADMGLPWLKRILTEPEDIRRLAELEACIATSREKIAESNRRLMEAEDHQANQSDAEISQKIIGTWIVDIEESPDYTVKGSNTFSSDGSYVVKARITQYGKWRDEQFDGTWQIKDGLLIGTNFTHDREKILRVDDEELVSLVDGNLLTSKRLK